MAEITVTGDTVKVTVHARRDSSFRRLEGKATAAFMEWQHTSTARNMRYTSVLIAGRESTPDNSNPAMYYCTYVYKLEGLPEPAYPMVEGEGAPQYTFDIAPETQLSMF